MSEVHERAQRLLDLMDSVGVKQGSQVMVAAKELRKSLADAREQEPSGWPVICIDFDGVLHSYTSGWKGADIIADPPVEGAMLWLHDLVVDERGVVPCIYSSRSKDPVGVAAMQQWLRDHLAEMLFQHPQSCLRMQDAHVRADRIVRRIKFPTQKPPAHITIDDRAWCFNGIFPSTDTILAFKPWNRR